MKILCPVCRRPADVSPKGHVREHLDGIDQPCVLGGKYIKTRRRFDDA